MACWLAKFWNATRVYAGCFLHVQISKRTLQMDAKSQETIEMNVSVACRHWRFTYSNRMLGRYVANDLIFYFICSCCNSHFDFGFLFASPFLASLSCQYNFDISLDGLIFWCFESKLLFCRWTSYSNVANQKKLPECFQGSILDQMHTNTILFCFVFFFWIIKRFKISISSMFM